MQEVFIFNMYFSRGASTQCVHPFQDRQYRWPLAPELLGRPCVQPPWFCHTSCPLCHRLTQAQPPARWWHLHPLPPARESARDKVNIYLKKSHLLLQSKLFLYVFAWGVFEGMQGIQSYDRVHGYRISLKSWITCPLRWRWGSLSEFVPVPIWKDCNPSLLANRVAMYLITWLTPLHALRLLKRKHTRMRDLCLQPQSGRCSQQPWPLPAAPASEHSHLWRRAAEMGGCSAAFLKDEKLLLNSVQQIFMQ